MKLGLKTTSLRHNLLEIVQNTLVHLPTINQEESVFTSYEEKPLYLKNSDYLTRRSSGVQTIKLVVTGDGIPEIVEQSDENGDKCRKTVKKGIPCSLRKLLVKLTKLSGKQKAESCHLIIVLARSYGLNLKSVLLMFLLLYTITARTILYKRTRNYKLLPFFGKL
uniref:Uncharacterized protein n=1 Tax=Glossina austeni TaxID=7395 RepID=A0A1A9UI10_GLOAU